MKSNSGITEGKVLTTKLAFPHSARGWRFLSASISSDHWGSRLRRCITNAHVHLRLCDWRNSIVDMRCQWCHWRSLCTGMFQIDCQWCLFERSWSCHWRQILFTLVIKNILLILSYYLYHNINIVGIVLIMILIRYFGSHFIDNQRTTVLARVCPVLIVNDDGLHPKGWAWIGY